jgi:hypothetical protein
MTLLDRLAKNSYLTIAPQSEQLPSCGATRFRWGIHIALPFTLPSRTCLHQKVVLEGQEYDYSIHNYLDRLTVFPVSQTTWPSVYLVERSQPTPLQRTGWRQARETLQSVACFVEVAEYNNPAAAFANAGDKIKACFRFLSDHLAALQSSMPYLASWQIYPLSQFDVGLVYHGVEHFCPPKERWDSYRTGLTINIARQLHQPLSLVRFPHGAGTTTPADLSNELLAEAQVSLFRGLYRPVVLNSYQAVESLANVVFKAKQTAKLMTGGLAQAIAEAEAEKTRFKHRVDIKFLVHHGLFEACSHSLCNEHKGKYDDLCELNKLRHKVAHAGEKPSPSEAEAAHLLCCEVVQ